MNKMNEMIFDQVFKEAHNRFYKLSPEPMTKAHKVAFDLGKLNYQIKNGGIAQYVMNGFYQLAKDELLPAVGEGIKNGIDGLKPLLDFLELMEKLFTGEFYCPECNGSGEVGLEEEECEDCSGTGRLEADENQFEEVDAERAEYTYYENEESVLFDAYGQLVLFYMSKEDRESILTEMKLKTMFNN